MATPQNQHQDDASLPAALWPLIQPVTEAYALALQDQFNVSQWWPAENLLAHQLAQVQFLIHHAVRTVPFYQSRLATAASHPPGRLTMSAFRDIPVMTRRDIQTAGDDLFTRELPNTHGQMHVVTSSGSTGRPIEVRGTTMNQVMGMALTLRGHRWHRRDLMAKNVDVRSFHHGAAEIDRWAALPETGPVKRINIAQPIADILDQVLAEDSAYLQSHPFTIKGLVELSVATDRRPTRLREVRTFGEALPAGLREQVRDHWGVPLADNYSANEIGTIAQQCPSTTNLHVQAENVLVEILRPDGSPAAPGESGRVVLTTLHNFASPLIRYEIGDHARLGPPCPCGRGLPVLEQILGRERNLLIYPDGNRVFPDTRVGLVDNVGPLHQFQLLQPDVDRLEFHVVPARPWTDEDESRLRAFLHRKFRHAFAIDIVYRDDIPRSTNGKFEEFRSDVSQ